MGVLQPRRSTALRRYPALGYLAATAALALLLPSGLTVPNSGPPTLAEFAPVPGQGEGQSDSSALGLPSSTGLGAGLGEGGAAAGDPADPLAPDVADELPPPETGELVRKPGTKRCVGDPPRQTEDPLSPPCIAFFEGDNGGVTADEVVVVAAIQNISRDPQAGEVVDCSAPVTDEDSGQDLLCKAFQTYFNHRYQTYQRTVRLYLAHDVGLERLDEKYSPFTYLTAAGSAGETAKRLGILNVAYTGGARKSFRKNAPFEMAFRPDRDDMAAMAATHSCAKLADRSARYAGDAAYHDTRRTFAFWTTEATINPYDQAVLDALERRCGVSMELVATGTTDQTIATRLKSEGITTVLVSGGELIAAMTQQATRAQWFPEWIVPGAANFVSANINYVGRLADPLQWRNAFAVTVDYRRPQLSEQTWFRAFREGCPDCPEPSLTGGGTAGAFTYDAMSLLFYGIQAAGPRLTVENVDRGLHAIPEARSRDPFTPAAYFAPGNSTFVKDATALWWDPTGVAPGTTERGCWRLAQSGTRFRAGEWPAGDDDLRAPGPCQGDVFRG